MALNETYNGIWSSECKYAQEEGFSMGALTLVLTSVTRWGHRNCLWSI